MKQILKLTRFNMSIAIAFSAVAGYVFSYGSFTWKSLAVFAGVLLLAGSATAINQYQEKDRDALMLRTKDRPLASGRMKVQTAILLAIIMGIGGLWILYYFTNLLTALLGLINLLWYNAVYTPLKTRTGFVVIVGAVTGALPPMMGWTAAGGILSDPKILFIASFLFLWQIPHFLLLLLKYQDDYRKAGFKSATNTMTEKQIKSIVFIWILGTCFISLAFPLFGLISGKLLITTIILLNIMLIAFFYKSAYKSELKSNLGRAFGSLYLYQLSILAILILQALK